MNEYLQSYSSQCPSVTPWPSECKKENVNTLGFKEKLEMGTCIHGGCNHDWLCLVFISVFYPVQTRWADSVITPSSVNIPFSLSCWRDNSYSSSRLGSISLFLFKYDGFRHTLTQMRKRWIHLHSCLRVWVCVCVVLLGSYWAKIMELPLNQTLCSDAADLIC